MEVPQHIAAIIIQPSSETLVRIAAGGYLLDCAAECADWIAGVVAPLVGFDLDDEFAIDDRVHQRPSAISSVAEGGRACRVTTGHEVVPAPCLMVFDGSAVGECEVAGERELVEHREHRVIEPDFTPIEDG